jgi:predicted anti-sigma-YlaC factor YlaD
MANNKQTFITESSLRAQVMYDSLARYLEIAMLYGQRGIGATKAANGTATSSTKETIIMTDASWSPGIWAGAVGAQVQFYASGSLVSSSTDAIFTVRPKYSRTSYTLMLSDVALIAVARAAKQTLAAQGISVPAPRRGKR